VGRLVLSRTSCYLIGSAVFQCMEYRWTTKVRQKTFYFSFFKLFAGQTRLTWTFLFCCICCPRDPNSARCV
jgi:hypothetical protein